MLVLPPGLAPSCILLFSCRAIGNLKMISSVKGKLRAYFVEDECAGGESTDGRSSGPDELGSDARASVSPDPPESSAGRFRLSSTSIFLTFPRCAVPGAPVLRALELLATSKHTTILFAVVGVEAHEDGSPHLHVFAKFGRRVNFSGPSGIAALDSLVGQHGDYEVPRSAVDCVRYCIKGGCYEELGFDAREFVTAGETRKSTKSAIYAKMIINGSSSCDVMETDPGYFMLHKSHIEAFESFVERKNMRDDRGGFPVDLPDDLEVDTGTVSHLVYDWMKSNLLCARVFKKKQLYLWGPPDMGKTSFVLLLASYLRVCYMGSELYDDDYEDNLYDFCFFDEFAGNRTLRFMNEFLQGSPMKIQKKSKPALLKKQNIPVIICSNIHPMDVYKCANVRSVEAFLTRVQVVEVGGLQCLGNLFEIIEKLQNLFKIAK